ncbi:hypothetical protein FHX48_001889 [Microbacterium halimionae]|uniref:Glycosyltransferase 2-like domain-containing protein n=1 Tax=Microbacterium halimionae TaxID=1526413 RepID=A0A7W3JPX8_9MICO|nr:glycosyltransferase [Microbacterium halimionae]MBA8816796.1 hypothetical protein [Microbacterium halimionae]NII94908.1 hypothetical protein [Microbacterium halimionae]
MKVSVIAGFYNRAPVLERTLRSLVAQSLTDIEILIFDDASSDNTSSVMTRLQDELQDSRIRYVRYENNRGFAQGLRDAVAMTKGEFIAIQGSGDVSLPQRLEMQSAILESRPDVGAVGCWYTNIEEDSGIARVRRPDADNTDFDALLRGNVFSHGEVMIRRSYYDAVGGYRPEFKNCQDYDLWLRIAQVSRIATVPQVLYERFIQFDGVTYDVRKLALQSRYSIFARRLAQLGEIETSASLERLRVDGIEAVVPLSDRSLQKKYVRGCIRFAVWGASGDAVTMAKGYIASGWKRRALILFAKTFNARFFAPGRFVAHAVLGVRRNRDR